VSFKTIPLSQNKPWQTFNISLNDVIYGLTFSFNTRSNTWTMEISDSNENILISGVPLLIERNLLTQYRYLNLPTGVMFVLDNTGKQEQPSLYSFGTTHTFYYEDGT